nr:type II toxin-antitoxin system RelB/DinJ family antitoxin [Oceanococcus sp. HetDA_MAG_MS8]
MSTSTIHVRVDDETKAKATQALEAMGLDLSTAVRVYLARISAEQRLPFELRVPNLATKQAIHELESGQGHRAKSVDSLFDELSADD